MLTSAPQLVALLALTACESGAIDLPDLNDDLLATTPLACEPPSPLDADDLDFEGQVGSLASARLDPCGRRLAFIDFDQPSTARTDVASPLAQAVWVDVSSRTTEVLGHGTMDTIELSDDGDTAVFGDLWAPAPSELAPTSLWSFHAGDAQATALGALGDRLALSPDGSVVSWTSARDNAVVPHSFDVDTRSPSGFLGLEFSEDSAWGTWLDDGELRIYNRSTRASTSLGEVLAFVGWLPGTHRAIYVVPDHSAPLTAAAYVVRDLDTGEELRAPAFSTEFDPFANADGASASLSASGRVVTYRRRQEDMSFSRYVLDLDTGVETLVATEADPSFVWSRVGAELSAVLEDGDT